MTLLYHGLFANFKNISSLFIFVYKMKIFFFKINHQQVHNNENIILKSNPVRNSWPKTSFKLLSCLFRFQQNIRQRSL